MDSSTIRHAKKHTKNLVQSDFREMFIFKMASKMAAESVKSLYLNYYST